MTDVKTVPVNITSADVERLLLKGISKRGTRIADSAKQFSRIAVEEATAAIVRNAMSGKSTKGLISKSQIYRAGKSVVPSLAQAAPMELARLPTFLETKRETKSEDGAKKSGTKSGKSSNGRKKKA